MPVSKALIVLAAILGSATWAVAAEAPVANISGATGKVLVDRGQGFASVADAGLNAGDRVFVGEKSSAVVAYAGCTVKLDKPTVFVVGKASPCAQGASVAKVGSVVITPASVTSATISNLLMQSIPDDLVGAPSAGFGSAFTTFGPGAFVPAGFIAGAFAYTYVSRR